MAIGSLLLQGGIPIAMESGKYTKACARGNGTKQLFGSAINVAKWVAGPAAIVALCNPVTVLGAAFVGIASFLAPSLIPDIDFSGDSDEKKLDYQS